MQYVLKKFNRLSALALIKGVVIAVSFFTAVFMLFNDLTVTSGHRLYFFVPLLFASILIFCKAIFRNLTNVIVLLFMLISIVRFIVMPFFGSLCGYGYTIGKFIEPEYHERAVLLAIFEMAVCTGFLNFAASKVLKANCRGILQLNISIDKAKPLFYGLILITVALLTVPDIFGRYSLIFLQTEYENASSLPGIVFTVVELGRVSIMLLALAKLKKIHDQNPSVWCLILSLILVLINACIVDGLSRWTILMPLLVYGLLILNWYPRYVKGLIAFFVAAIVAFYIISTGARYGLEEFNSLSIYHNLQMYFSGIRNMAFGIKAQEYVAYHSGLYPIQTVLADLFYSATGLSHFVERANTTMVIFNDFLRGDGVSYDMIIPFISQSGVMLGNFAAPLLQCAVIYAALKISVKFYQGIDFFKYYYLAVAAIWLCRMMTVNITIMFSQLFNNLIVFYAFYLLNAVLIKKRKEPISYGKKVKSL